MTEQVDIAVVASTLSVHVASKRSEDRTTKKPGPKSPLRIKIRAQFAASPSYIPTYLGETRIHSYSVRSLRAMAPTLGRLVDSRTVSIVRTDPFRPCLQPKCWALVVVLNNQSPLH
jgi:hypothetical protein